MSGLQIGDVAAGIKAAWWLYNMGFVEENKADVIYRNFRNEIQGFAQLLQQLDEAMANAHNQFIQRSLTIKAKGKAYDPLATDFDSERCRFIGDFVATLEECKTVLQQNKNLHTRGSNIFRNIDWKMRIESKVMDLRRRIEFHSTKILLVIDRLSLGLLTDIDAKVDDLLGLTEQNLMAAHEIRELLHNFYNAWKGSSTGRPQVLDPDLEDQHAASSEIQAKLLQRAEIHPDKKKGFLEFPEQIPLAEGFNALLYHFEKSLEIVGRDQTPDHYLSLLKARWLADNIKLGQAYKDARPGFYYKRAISRVEQAIHVRVKSSAVIKFEDDVLLALPGSSFKVWYCPEQTSAVRHDPTTPRADEKVIIALDLVSDDPQSQDKVTILQRSDSHFRIVIESVTDDHPYFIDKIYVATEDKLIPRYALPSLKVRNHEIAIFARGEEILYRFHNAKDLYLFQKALMGYQVSHHVRGVKCGFSDRSINSTGTMQIWQDPIGSDCLHSQSLMPPTSPLTLTSSNSTGASGSNARQSSIAPSFSATTVSRISEGYQAKPIAFPALTIYTKLSDRRGRSRLALIYLKLDGNTELMTEKCGCKDEATYDECTLLYIERPKEAKFSVFVLYCDLDKTGQSDPNTWDLSPFRIPEHARFKRLQRVETTFLVLQFPSLTKKKQFHDELNDRFLLRQLQRQEQDKFLKQMRHRQDRPSRASAQKVPQLRPPQSHSSNSSFASRTPSIEEVATPSQLKDLDFGTNFRDEIEKIYVVRSSDKDDESDDDDEATPAASQVLRRPVNAQQSPTRTTSTITSLASKNIFKRRRKAG